MINYSWFSSQPFLQPANLKKLNELETLQFLKKIYAYPPSIGIKTENLNTLAVSESKGLPKSTTLEKDQSYYISNLTKTIPSSITASSISYKNKVFTSNFYKLKTTTIQKAIENIPVYAILNGHNDIILADPLIPALQLTNSNPIKRASDDFFGLSNRQSPNPNPKLGLFFFNKKDALMYLESVLEADPTNADQTGLAIHCLGLDSAYSITKQYHPNVDFRFVPDLEELARFLKKNVSYPNFIFDYSQHQLNFAVRQVSLLPKIGNLPLNKLSPLFSTVQNNEYYKGVPVFFIQYKNRPQTNFGILYRYLYDTFFINKIRKNFFRLDSIVAKICYPLNFATGRGQQTLVQGDFDSIDKQENITNYVFFSAEQAISFFEKNKDDIAYFSGSRALPECSNFIRQGRIYVTNLEDFLERWESSVLKNGDNAAGAFNTRKTIFTVSPKMLEDNTIPAKGPLKEQFVDFLVLKYKKFQSSFNLFTRA